VVPCNSIGRINKVQSSSQVKKVKSNYFIVHPKVDQRAGQLSLPQLGLAGVPS